MLPTVHKRFRLANVRALCLIAGLTYSGVVRGQAALDAGTLGAEHIDAMVDRERAVGCLSSAIAYEAGFESVEGQQAVAEVILNRLRHPAFPKSVCAVVFAGSERRTGCQFSFTCDGSLGRRISATMIVATRAIAEAALDGLNPIRVAGATHYHANYVSPYWAPSLIRVTRIGAHIFYRGAGARDQIIPTTPYVTTGEPLIAKLATSDGSAATPEATTVQIIREPQKAVGFAPWGLASPTLTIIPR